MAPYVRDFKDLQRVKPSTLFLAEGEAEVGLLECILKIENADPEDCVVVCFRGVSRLASQAKSIAKVLQVGGVLQSIRVFGPLADAETDRVSRIDAVVDAAKAFGFSKCDQALRAGKQHIQDDGRAFTYFLSPELGKDGAIEDVIIKEILASQFASCIEGLEDCLTSRSFAKLEKKAIVQIYIALVKNSGLCGIYNGFHAGALNVTSPAYDDIRDFVIKTLTI